MARWLWRWRIRRGSGARRRGDHILGGEVVVSLHAVAGTYLTERAGMRTVGASTGIMRDAVTLTLLRY